MTERTFLGLKDFTQACQLAAEFGFDVQDAKYDGINFGYWSVQLSRKGMRPRVIVWDARDYRVAVMARDANGDWQDDWVIKEPTRDTAREILDGLLSLTE